MLAPWPAARIFFLFFGSVGASLFIGLFLCTVCVVGAFACRYRELRWFNDANTNTRNNDLT